jgi:acetyl-CoA carboxylase alpha subunit
VDHEASAALLDVVLDRSLRDLLALNPARLLEERYGKFRRMGQFFESAGAGTTRIVPR